MSEVSHDTVNSALRYPVQRALAKVGAITSLLCVAGCSVLREVDVTRELAADPPRTRHERVGRDFSRAGFLIAIPCDIVCLPVTLPAYVVLERKSDKALFLLFVPGAVVQGGFYHVGSCLAYPFDACAGPTIENTVDGQMRVSTVQ